MWFVKLVQSFVNPVLDSLAILITHIGEENFYLLIAAATVWCVNRELGMKMHFAFYMNNIINALLKNIFAIPRHYGQMDIRVLNEVPVGGYSFPSGHVQNLTSYLSSIILYVKRKSAAILSFLLILLLSLSRIYLGVHTPMDVVGGAFIAFCVVLGANKLFEYRINNRQLLFLAVLAVLLVGAFFIVSQRYMLAIGHITALIAATAVNKYIKFREAKTISGKVAALMIGIAILLKIENSIEQLQINKPIFYYMSGFLKSIFVLVVFPLFMLASEYLYKKVRKS